MKSMIYVSAVLLFLLKSQISLSNSTDTDYIVFPSCASASQEAQRINTNLGYPLTLIECSDSRYQALNLLLTRVWTSYQNEISAARSLPMPQIVLYERFDPDAAICFDSETQKIPWLITATTALMLPTMTDESRMAILAHELAHALLKHPLRDVPTNTVKFYFAGSEIEPLGFQQVDDSIARSLGEHWLANAEIAGATHFPQQNHLPFGNYGNPLFPAIFNTLLMSDLEKSRDPSCINANQSWKKYQAELNSTKSYFDFNVYPTSSNLSFINQYSLDFLREIEKCPLPQRAWVDILNEANIKAYMETTRVWYGGTVLAKVRSILITHKKTFEQAPNYALGLIVVTKELHAALAVLESDPRFSKLRYFTIEEQADDLAIAILNDLEMPFGVKTWMMDTLRFMSTIPGVEDDYAAKCALLLKGGHVPPYGSFIDMHHSACFRAFHNEQMLIDGKT